MSLRKNTANADSALDKLEQKVNIANQQRNVLATLPRFRFVHKSSTALPQGCGDDEEGSQGMIATLFAALFSLSALLALGVIASTLHRYAPRVRALRSALEQGPRQQELRFRIVTHQIGWNDGKVIAFTPRRARSGQPRDWRAAA